MAFHKKSSWRLESDVLNHETGIVSELLPYEERDKSSESGKNILNYESSGILTKVTLLKN